MTTRKEFNLTNPVSENYTEFDQSQDFQKANPVIAADCYGDKTPIPEISERMDLTLKQAVAELEKFNAAPAPVHGWSSGIASKINNRKMYLKTTIADLVLAERKT